jgi:hypothetical protein
VKGIRNVKHLPQEVKKHEISEIHIENYVKLKFFSFLDIVSQLNESYRIAIQHHNKLEDQSRYILGRIINCTVKPILNGISRVQNIFLLKPGFRLIKVYYDSHGT